MARTKRFLFVISDVGSEHRSSACAVREAMARIYGRLARAFPQVRARQETGSRPRGCVGHEPAPWRALD